ncbi:MAG TPA: membrane protein insertase YidC [Terracidiphilus sp.]|nr:membrane protein insertase YidC [Terracidiphilus sp.]
MPEIQNPNLQSQGHGGGGGGDIRGTIFFMLLVFTAVIGYQYFFAKPKPEGPATQTQTAQSAAPQTPAAAPTSAPPAQVATSVAPQAPAPTITAAGESEVTVENELYKIVLTNRGAQVKHWYLKKYFDSSGKPLDMVQPQAAARFGLPLSLFTYPDSPVPMSQLNEALYQTTVNGEPIGTGSNLALAPATVVYHYSQNGIEVVKSIHFDTSYVVNVSAEVKRYGTPVRALIQWPAGLGDMEEFRQVGLHTSQIRTPTFFAWSLDNHQDSLAASKVSGNATLNAPYQYAAISDVYFAAAFLPDSPDDTTVVTLHNSVELPVDPSDPNSKQQTADVLGVAIGSIDGVTRARLFAGPKASEILGSVHAVGPSGRADGPSLESLIQFGWLTVIAKPLYLVLRFNVNHFVPNWGWAIIIFTSVFTLLMIPTRIMMTKSQLKMKRIKPKVDAIQARFKHLKTTDPRRAEMNTEMMALYKQEGVNMYGSCLPMLVQMPLFFAYFRVLQNAVELRQAHWFWLKDLSQPDPTHILPIFIIITMFLTQFITPSPQMDRTQQMMMAFMMPVMFGFILWNYASGLALYWGTSNIIYLTTQIGINYSSLGHELRASAGRGKRPGGTTRR